MKKVSALLATGFVFSTTVAGWASPAAASDYNRTVKVCNYTNQTVDVAKVSDESGGMVSRGWYIFDNGECSTLNARFLRMKSPSGSTWAFNGTFTTQFCVTSAAFGIYSPNSQRACNTYGGTMATFSSVQGPGKVVIMSDLHDE